MKMKYMVKRLHCRSKSIFWQTETKFLFFSLTPAMNLLLLTNGEMKSIFFTVGNYSLSEETSLYCCIGRS